MKKIELIVNPEPIGPLGIDEVIKVLPHRYPFLLLDGIRSVTAGKDKNGQFCKVGTKVIAFKNVTVNEPHFTGHFPACPIMPGVLIIEALAQAAAFAFYEEMQLARNAGKDVQTLLLGVDGARFRKPVKPGDCLELETNLTKLRSNFVTYTCQAKVNGKLVANVDLFSSLSTS